MRHVPLLSLFALLLTAPGCWESRPTVGPPGMDSGGKLSGLVIKGRVSGATLNVYRLNGAERGAQVATTTTDAEGAFAVGVGASHGPFLVIATGGSFVDEASGATIRLSGDELTALVPSFPVGTHLDGLLLTPVSHLAAGFALRQVRLGTAALDAAHDEALLLLNAHFGGLDWRRTVPVDVTASTSSQLDAPARAGLLLAGLSQEAYTIAEQAGLTPGGSVNALSLTSTLYEDLTADGYFDGLGEGGARLLLPSSGVFTPYPLDGQTVRFTLASAVNRFLSNPRCRYRITNADVQQLVRDLSRSSSPRLFRDAGSDFDTTPPSVSIRAKYQAADGSLVDASTLGVPFVRGVITLEVDAADDSTVRSLTVTQQGAPLTPAPRDNTAEHFVGTWDASLALDGELVFNVVAEDGRGNRGETLYKVHVDNTPPAIDVTLPVATYYSANMRVDASASDPGSGVASFHASGLEGFTDDADAVNAIRGNWVLPTALPDGPVTTVFTACDAVTNCASREVTFQVDRTPPVVTLWEAPPRYTKAATTSFIVQGNDTGAAVRTVRARAVGHAAEYVAQEIPGPAGERLFRLDNIALVDGLNTFQVWAEDNTGNSSITEALFVKVAQDTRGTKPILGSFNSYRDERGMSFAKNMDGSPALPLHYTWPAGTNPGPATLNIYKARTRLSHGPSVPSGRELEEGNPYNVPFLVFSANRNEETEAPITVATYSITVTCPTGCTFPTYSGPLIPSPRSSTREAIYDLPLSQETVPALLNLPSSPATLDITITFADSLGNDHKADTKLYFHVIGAPVSIVEDLAYPSRADPQSEHAYTLVSGRYGGMWGGTGSIRVARYIIHNPAPEQVHLGVNLSGAPWSISEDWNDIITSPTASAYSVDGTNFQYSYSWVASNYMGSPSTNYPCGGYAGSSAPQYPRHVVGTAIQFTCASLPMPSSRDLPVSEVASGTLGHAGFDGALPGGNETTLATPWALGYLVPKQGQLVLYLTRPRVPAPNGTPYVFQDLANGRGVHIQIWNQDFWQYASTTGCGAYGATCATYQARRITTELTSAKQTFSAMLKLTTYGGAGGEPIDQGTLTHSNKEISY